jgi:hypothetical protein
MTIQRIIFSLLIIFSINSFAMHDELISQLVASKLLVDKHSILATRSIKENRPLSGAELAEINEATQNRLILRDQAYEFFSRDLYLVHKRIRKDFTLSDDELKALMFSLSVALTLYDTTLYTYYKFHDNPKMRRLLNEKDSAYRREGSTFEKSIKGVFSFKNSLYLQRAIKIYNLFYLERQFMFDDEELVRTHRIIQASFLYQNFQTRKTKGVLHDFFLIIGSRIKIGAKAKLDFFNFLANSVLYHGSRAFGNAIGGIQKRRGILYRDPKFLSRVTSNLKPLDILLEKTPFRLTDSFIPGFWGHTAIYLGTQEQLEEMGIWDNKLVQQYSKEISRGKFIIEALRDKVQLNTLDHFSDIDDFSLIRMRSELTVQEQGEHILRALSHVGKKYDFSFDVETGDTIVCSELHYRTFIDINFQTTIYLGRSTISVDQVAEQAKSNMPFGPIMMYLNGMEVGAEMIQETYDGVLQPLGKEIQTLDFHNDAA